MKRALFLLALAGCRTERDWAMVASSIRVEGGLTDQDYESPYGHTRFKGDGSYAGLSFAPFAYLEPAKVVLTRPALPEEDTGPPPYMKPAHRAEPLPDGRCSKCGAKLQSE